MFWCPHGCPCCLKLVEGHSSRTCNASILHQSTDVETNVETAGVCLCECVGIGREDLRVQEEKRTGVEHKKECMPTNCGVFK